MKRILPLLFILTAAAAIAACGGGGKNLDTAKVEQDLQKITSDAGVESKAECPDEVEDIKKGTTYECTLTYAGNANNKQTVQMQIGDNDESVFANEDAASGELAIRGIVAQSDEDPATVCEHVSEDILEQLGGDDCATAAAEQDDGKPTVIKSIDVQGQSATMVTDESTTTFEQDEQGAWVATAIE